jgi:hypothetical protein
MNAVASKQEETSAGGSDYEYRLTKAAFWEREFGD